MSTRRNFSTEFKVKVALEALVGDKTLAELATKHDVHPNMITQGKRRAKESLPEAFGKKALSWVYGPRRGGESVACQDRSTHRGERFFVESLRSMSHDRRACSQDRSTA